MSNTATVSLNLNPRAQALAEQLGVTDTSKLVELSMDLLQKAVEASQQGLLVGSVPAGTQVGEDGIVEILFSQEMFPQSEGA